MLYAKCFQLQLRVDDRCILKRKSGILATTQYDGVQSSCCRSGLGSGRAFVATSYG